MARIPAWLATAASLIAALPASVHACSPGMLSLHEQFDRQARVFLGTVRERIREPVAGQAVYRIFVDEAFKGLPEKGKWPGELEVTLSESEQCGLGKASRNARVLVFMNEGDVVNLTSGSRLVWREAEQKEAHLNPVMDDLFTLRRMLSPNHPGGIVPDEDAAVHQALKVLIVVFGRKEVGRQMPFTATYQADAPEPDGRVWRVEGSPDCVRRKADPCRQGAHGVEVNRWSGEAVRMFSVGRP